MTSAPRVARSTEGLKDRQPPVKGGRVIVVAALGATQTIAWASSYYKPAILGNPIAQTLHLPLSVFFGSFSGAFSLVSLCSYGPCSHRVHCKRLEHSVIVRAANIGLNAHGSLYSPLMPLWLDQVATRTPLIRMPR